MTEFKIGKTYKSAKMGNFKIISRTARRITTKNELDEIKTVGIYIFDGSECAKPMGNYSMCPVIRADRESI